MMDSDIAELKAGQREILVEVKGIKASLERRHNEHDALDRRVQNVERKMFTVWIVGPILLALVAFFSNIKRMLG